MVVNLNQGIVRAIASTAQAPKEGDDKWGWPTMGYLFSIRRTKYVNLMLICCTKRNENSKFKHAMLKVQGQK